MTNTDTATTFYPTWTEANRNASHGQEVKMGSNGQGQQMYYVSTPDTTAQAAALNAAAAEIDARQLAEVTAAARKVATGTFDTTSGVTSSPLYGPRITWARQIKAWYPSVAQVVVDGRKVRAMHTGGQPFTLGFVTEHTDAR